MAGSIVSNRITIKSGINFLWNKDFKVLRFWNNEVMENMEGVLTVILNTLKIPLSLTLSHKGRGD